jgi:polynucleotide 5'-hydroxyl-kinase GRC3/NOL9
MPDREETGIVPLPEWTAVSDELASSLPATVLVIGTSDSGKSTLVKYLTQSLVSRGLCVAVVDADIGQSSLCLPGTVSLGAFRSADAATRFNCERSSFLGSVSPVPVMRLLASETGRLAGDARRSAAVTLVDTTGLVAGEIGRGLKAGKTTSVGPDMIIALQRGTELSHILSAEGTRVVQLQPSPLIKSRSAAVRTQARMSKLERYFRESRHILVLRDQVEIRKFGRVPNQGWQLLRAGMIVGVGRGHEPDTAALGIVAECDQDSVVLTTPLGTARGIKRIIVGNMFIGGNPPGDGIR